MRFVLTYSGPLRPTQRKQGRSKSSRIEIRKQISPQLETLWAEDQRLIDLRWKARVPDGCHTYLGGIDSPDYVHYREPPSHPVQDGYVDKVAEIARHQKAYLPLVRSSLGLTCSLDILFLRVDDPGAILKKSGDIDNRIKTFIDALAMPSDAPDGDETEELNYRLLEDDSLVRGLSIRTERLWRPQEANDHHVQLIVSVEVHVERPGHWNLPLI